MAESKRQSLGRWGNGQRSTQHQAEDPYDSKRELLAAQQHSGANEKDATSPTMPKKPGTGFEAFVERGLAQAGARSGGGGDNKSGAVFQTGPLKGLNRGQAIEKMRDMYGKLDDSVRKKYEDRANLKDVRSDRDNAAGAQYDKDVANYVDGKGSGGAEEATVKNGGLVPVMTNGPMGTSTVRYVSSGIPEQAGMAQERDAFSKADPDVGRMGAAAITAPQTLPEQGAGGVDPVAAAAQTAAGAIGDVGPDIGPPTVDQANARLNATISESLQQMNNNAAAALKTPSINGQPIPDRGPALTKYDKASGKMVSADHKPDETGMDIKRNFPGHDQVGGGGGKPPMPEFTDGNGVLQNGPSPAFDFKQFAANNGMSPEQTAQIQAQARFNVTGQGVDPSSQPVPAGTAAGGAPSSGYGNTQPVSYSAGTAGGGAPSSGYGNQRPPIQVGQAAGGAGSGGYGGNQPAPGNVASGGKPSSTYGGGQPIGPPAAPPKNNFTAVGGPPIAR